MPRSQEQIMGVEEHADGSQWCVRVSMAAWWFLSSMCVSGTGMCYVPICLYVWLLLTSPHPHHHLTPRLVLYCRLVSVPLRPQQFLPFLTDTNQFTTWAALGHNHPGWCIASPFRHPITASLGLSPLRDRRSIYGLKPPEKSGSTKYH